MSRRQTTDDDAPSDRKSSWIPWAFVGFFGVVFAVNAVLVAAALESWTGLETDHAYERGLAFDKTLDAAHKQAELGWKVDVAFQASDKDHADVTVTMLDKGGAPIHGADLRARFIRPTNEGFDGEVRLRELGEGRYGAATSVALAGQWDLVVAAIHEGNSYQVRKRVFVPR
ncbi:MAG: FixH family protein [Alphaproteobacteria bacterium]